MAIARAAINLPIMVIVFFMMFARARGCSAAIEGRFLLWSRASPLFHSLFVSSIHIRIFRLLLQTVKDSLYNEGVLPMTTI